MADGAVLVESDRVVAVGPRDELCARADRHHRVDGVLLPGLVDARTRIECADVPSPANGPYHHWRDAVVSPLAEWDGARVGRSAQRGVHALLRSGTTCVGDVVLRGPGVPAASRAGLVGDSWVEIDGVDVASQDDVVAALQRTLRLPAPGRRVGITVPGTHATGAGVLQALSALVAEVGASMQTVVAASREEAKAVTNGAGPLAIAALKEKRDYEWLDSGSGKSPLAYADGCGVLRRGWSVAHATKFRRGQMQVLTERGVASVMSPRAIAVVGRPRLSELAAAHTPIALCTEGAQGPPDVLAEASAWVATAKEQGLEGWPGDDGMLTLAEAAVRLVTIDGAKAMGWGGVAGTIAPGRRADFVGLALATTPDEVYEDVVARGAGRQVLTVLAGVRRARRDDPAVAWREHELREEETT